MTPAVSRREMRLELGVQLDLQGSLVDHSGDLLLCGLPPENMRLIRFPADHFGWTGLGHQWKFVPVRRSWLSSSMQRWAMTASRSASVAK